MLTVILALVGSNSAIIPAYFGKNLKNYFNSSSNKNEIQEIHYSPTQLVNPNNNLQLGRQTVNNHINPVIDHGVNIVETPEIKLETVEELTNLIDIPNLNEIGLFSKPTIKQIYREIRRENSVSKIEKDELEAIKKEINNLSSKGESFKKAFSNIMTYQTEGDEKDEVKCVGNNAKFCYSDKSKKVSKLTQEQRTTLRDFFKSYMILSQKMLSLENRLIKSSFKKTIKDTQKQVKSKEEILIALIKREEKLRKVLQFLQDLHWDEDEILFKYLAKSESSHFGWSQKWEDNPFSLFFESRQKWEVHMMRIVELEKKLKRKPQRNERILKELENVHDEIRLLIASNLLKRMDQIQISPEEKEFVDIPNFWTI